MEQVFNKWKIHSDLVRIILFRVLPGQEVSVGRQIEKECVSFGLSKGSFRVFRLFGSYDLAFIQDTSKLIQSDFVQLGTIPGITGSTEYVCYNWVPAKKGSKPLFRIQQLSDPLVALCFLKINPVLAEEVGLEAELGLGQYLSGIDKNIQMLGTMGWFEIILVVSDSSLSRVLSRIGRWFPRLAFQVAGDKAKVFAEKTFTMFGHDLDVSDPPRGKQKAVSIAKELQQGDLEVHFSASCTPGAMTKVQNAAQKHFNLMKSEGKPKITFRLGARDLDFKLNLKDVNTLNDLLKRLDSFRNNNAKDLIRTHTELQYRLELSKYWKSLKPPTDRRKTMVLELSKADAKKLCLLGPEGAAAATAIYQFNNLLENRLLIDAFLDMLRALTRLKREMIQQKKPLTPASRLRLVTLLQYYHQAVSQRYQGAYLGVEEAPWGASFGVQPAGMGIQRILKALELFSGEVLRRYGKIWGGLVLVGRHRAPTMEHFEDILLIPPNDALNMERHWAMAHELMHVLQFLDPGLCSLNILGESCKISTGPGKLLLECITDIMEFKLSCSLTIEEYLKLVWEYLAEGINDLTEQEQLESYLIRSFAVFYLAKSKAGVIVKERQIRKVFNEQFIPLIEGISKRISRLKVADLRGQRPLELAFLEFNQGVLPHLEVIRKHVEALAVKGNKPNISEINRSVKRIRSGQIIPQKDLTHPDVVAWQLVKDGNIGKRDVSMESLTWLLSLWHKYQVAGNAPKISSIYGG